MLTTRLPDAQRRPRHVAIGTFDGVHLGHRAVIDDADTVLTFDPHPLEVLRPEAMPKLIMPLAIKRDVIEGLGVRELVTIPFDRSFAALEPQQFVDRILVERLGAQTVSVGRNFRFGARARGDAELLAAQTTFDTRAVEMIEIGSERVSSTRIRALLAAGEVADAARLLGAPFLLDGEVVPGDRRGRELGVPTANIVPDERFVVPGHGIYAAFADGQPAAVSIGVRPTFGTGKALLVEAHLIDVERDLYGQRLRLAFVGRLRGERWFADADALVAQMRADIDAARAVCAGWRGP